MVTGRATDIARARGRIATCQLGGWLSSRPAHPPLGAGRLGDGSVDFRLLSRQVLAAGGRGYTEVEIFNPDGSDTRGRGRGDRETSSGNCSADGWPRDLPGISAGCG